MRLFGGELSRRSAACGPLSQKLGDWFGDDGRDMFTLRTAVVEGLRQCDCSDIDIDIEALAHIVLLPLYGGLPLPYAFPIKVDRTLLQRVEKLGEATIEALTGAQ